MNRTKILRKIYQVCVRGGYNVFSCLVAKQSRAHEHSAAAAAAGTLSSTRATLDSSSTRATLDSSSTRTRVVAAVVLLRTARAALEGTSVSRFPSLYYCTAKTDTGPRLLDCSSATSTRDKPEHGAAKQSRAHEHSAAAAAAPSGTQALSSSGSSTQWHSSNTPVEKHSYACCCCCCFTAAYCSTMSSTNITGNAIRRAKIRYQV